MKHTNNLTRDAFKDQIMSTQSCVQIDICIVSKVRERSVRFDSSRKH